MHKGGHVALSSLTFEAHDEVLGYLGVNGNERSLRPDWGCGLGAGKTSTIDVLTGRSLKTSGTAFIAGHPVGSREATRHLSLCPQSDPLIELLTSREQLELYGKLSGATLGDVDRLMEMLQLSKHANTLSWVLSGGNKVHVSCVLSMTALCQRKLSMALALIAAPRVLFLGDPTPVVCSLD